MIYRIDQVERGKMLHRLLARRVGHKLAVNCQYSIHLNHKQQAVYLPNTDSFSFRQRFAEPIATSAVVALLIISGTMTFLNVRKLWAEARLVEHTQEVLNVLADLESSMKDAETGQRGYLITGNEIYLEPYERALHKTSPAIELLSQLTSDNASQQENIKLLYSAIELKWKHLKQAIELRRTEGFESARALIATNKGKQAMDDIRTTVLNMRTTEERLLVERRLASTSIYRTALFTTVISTIAGLTLLAGVLHLIQQRRKRAERDAAVIFKERERLQVTLASIGDGVIACDSSGKVTYLNAVSEGLTGWKNSEAQGQSLETVFRIVNEDTRETVENPALKSLRDGTIVGLANHTLLISKQGQETPIDDSAAPIRDAAGKIDGVVLVFRNVTQRRDEENRLKDAATFTRSIVDGLGEYVIVLDSDRHVLNTNRAFLNTFGITESDATGAVFDQLANGQFNLPVLQTLLDQLSNDDSHGHEVEFEHHFATAGKRALRLSAIRFDAGKKRPNCVLLVMSDVTDERRLVVSNQQLDQQMRWFLEQIQDYAIFMIDTDFCVSSWNQGVEHVLGFSEAEFIGQDVRQLIFTPEANADGTVATEFEIAAKSGHASDDRWMLRKGGRRFWASGITGAVRDEAGNLVGYSKVMRDLTLRKQAQDDLAELAAKLSEEGRRKNEFLATLAHELRNPLAPIKNAVQLMAMSELSSDVAELRETMARQVEQLVRLIDDLLDVSRISRGKVTLRKQVVDLHSIVAAAVEASKAFIDDNGQELNVRLADTGLVVEADPARLTQVISNLLNNSAKYSDPGCKIELTADVEDSQAVIRVHDNGIGIAPERLEDIFQMFAQVNDSLERGTAGLGIGLTLVKTLVELHGGMVTAESDGIGHGSLFTVKLPITDKIEQLPASREATTNVAKTPSFRILVVEDMRALSMVMARLLEKLGHEVQVVENGPAALEILDNWTPDIIFSDISMPGMTGYELAQRLRLRPDTAKTFLVAMTGYGQSSDREKAIQSGFDIHLVKPVDVKQLYSVFAELSQRGGEM